MGFGVHPALGCPDLTRSYTCLAPDPSVSPRALQVLPGVEQQQGADRADVAEEPPNPLLSSGLVLTHREELQLLLVGDKDAGAQCQALFTPLCPR